MNKVQERKKAAMWETEETECFLEIIKELKVTTLMDGKKFRTADIFKKVEKVFENKGYHRTHTQLLEKFKAMKKRFKVTIDALSVSGAGTEAKTTCPFFEELNEIFGHRPIVNQVGIDSTILPPDLTINDETSGCVSDTEVSVTISEGCSGSQADKFMEQSSDCPSLSPSTSTSHQSSSFFDERQSPSPLISISKNYLKASRSSSTPSSDSCRPDSSDKLSVSSKKRKICETPTYTRRESSRSGMKNMQQFIEEIIESQKDLLTKTIEEQRKLDKEMIDQYNQIFLQQTQMLLTGLQNLNSPLSRNYATFQQFPGVSTMPLNPMFTETPLHQPYPMQQMPLHANYNNTGHTSHEVQAHLKPDQSEKVIPKLTTPPSRQTSTIPRNETLIHSVLEEDKKSSDTDYEQVEYLDT